MPPLSNEINLNRRLFVGHLDPETDDRALSEYFGAYGEILDYIIMRYPDTRRSKCFGFVTFSETYSLDEVLAGQPHFIEGAPVEVKRAVPKEDLPAKPKREATGGGSRQTNMAGRLFVGRLNYDTNDTVLRAYFERFGELTDNVIMRYPDTRRSKGFGFVTFKNPADMEECIIRQPHTIDGKTVELQRATPREDKNSSERGSRHSGGDSHQPSIDSEHKLMRKLFIGNLNYSTTEEEIKEHFERYGNLEECTLMKFNDTGRSRGFAFLTFEKAFMVDDCQSSRPHELGGKVLEVKRAAPKANSRDPEALANVKKLWVGGFDENMTDEDIKDYFSDFGHVLTVDQVKWHDSGKKRGFGFVEFDDHDPVDKIVLKGGHFIKGKELEVKKALSKQEIAAIKDQQRSHSDVWNSDSKAGYQTGGFGGSSGGGSGFDSGSGSSFMGGIGNSFVSNMGMMDMFMNMSNNMGGSSGFGGGGSRGGSRGDSHRSGGGGGFESSSRIGRLSANEPVVSTNMEKVIMEKMNVIYENMAAITSMTGINQMGGGGRTGGGGGPVRSNFTGGARESSGPYARTSDTSKKQHYGW